MGRVTIGELPEIEPANIDGEVMVEVEVNGSSRRLKLSQISGYVAPNGIPSTADFSEEVGAIQEAVNQMQEGIEGVISASEAVQLSTEARLGAVAQRGIATEMAQQAVAARDQALSFATNSEAANEAAAAAAQASQLARDQAQVQAGNAAGSASASAGSASVANTKATEAGNSAAAAAASVITATSKANDAASSAQAASGSASSAGTHAGNASQSAIAASQSEQSAKLTVAAGLIGDFQQDGKFWTLNYTSAPALAPSMAADGFRSFTDEVGIGRVLVVSGNGASFIQQATIGVMSVRPSRTYRLRLHIKRMSGTGSFELFILGLNASFEHIQSINQSFVATTSYANYEVVASGDALIGTGCAYLRPFFRLVPGGGIQTLRVHSATLEDITESTAAATSAQAASNSMSLASTQATNAGISATAAQLSEVSAKLSAASIFPSDFQQDGKFWFGGVNTYVGDPATRTSITTNAVFSFATVAGAGRVIRVVTTSGSQDVSAIGALRVAAGRTYRLKARARTITAVGTPSGSLIAVGLDASYGYVPPTAGTHTQNLALNSWTDFTVTVTGTAMIALGHTYLRPIFRSNGTANTYEVLSIEQEDVTDSVAASQSAAAAASSATTATTKRDEASNFATSAQTHATTAQTQAGIAQGHAGTASTAASTASTKRDEASSFATAAQNHATNASSSAGNASGSASTAQGAASQSQTYRDASLSYSQAALTSEISAKYTAAATLPSDFQQDGKFWIEGHNGDPAVAASPTSGPLYNFPVDGTFGKVIQVVKPAVAGSYVGVSTRGLIRVQAGRSYRFNVSARKISGTGTQIEVGIVGLNASYNFVWWSPTFLTLTGSYADCVSTISGDTLLANGVVWVRGLFRPRGDVATALTLNARTAKIDDITESASAQASAQASASSAQTALTGRDQAGNYAIAANASKIAAGLSEGNASSSAINADTSRVLAESAAAAATSSQVLAASVGLNSINRNPVFSAWSNAGSTPDNYYIWALSGGSTYSRQVGANGGYEVEFVVAAGQNVGFGQGPAQAAAMGNGQLTPGWYVLEAEVKLVSGSLVGSGLYVGFWNSSGAYVTEATINFATWPDQSGSAPGVGVAGNTYRFNRLVQITAATAQQGVIHPMGGWTGFGTIAAKTLRYRKASVRAATQEEISRQTVLEPLQSTVTIQTDAIAGLQGRTAAYWSVLGVAGSGRARLALYADANGGGGVDIEGDVAIHGSLLVEQSIVAGKFLTDAGVNLAAIVPGSLNTTTEGAQVGSVTVNDSAPAGFLCSTGAISCGAKDSRYIHGEVHFSGASGFTGTIYVNRYVNGVYDGNPTFQTQLPTWVNVTGLRDATFTVKDIAPIGGGNVHYELGALQTTGSANFSGAKITFEKAFSK
jgi:hypothetical protein